jgi:hypothetical protein
MNKILYILAVLAALTSCSESYTIQGTSSVSSLDGSKLYLKGMKGQQLTDIDSCEVVHGKFKFTGNLDTVMMVSLYMDDRPLMLPVVLEQGEISVRIDNTSCKVSGTQLNELLYDFIDKHNQLDNQMNELDRRYSQMLLDAIDEQTIETQLSAEAAVIAAQEDSLVTHFIIDNFDNVLGPWAFMMVTANYDVPVFTPWIEDILSKATDRFKNDPYVKQYIEAAEHNQNLMNGMAEQTAPAPPAPGTVEGAAPALPTPSDMAKDNQ